MASGPTWNAQRKNWYVQYWIDGVWHRKTVAKGPRDWKEGSDPPDPKTAPPEAYAALDHWTMIEKQSRERAAAGLPSSLKTFLDDHVERYTNQATKESARETAKQFLAYCEDRGVVSFEQVTRKLCEGWIRHLAPDFAINTVTRKRAQIAAAWGAARKRGEIAANPWDGVKPAGKPTTKDRKAWTPRQFEALREEADEWLRDLLVLGINTGLRINAIMNLEWRDWLTPENEDQKNGYIRVRPELDKAKKGYKVPISSLLNELLKRRSADSNCHPVFIMTGRQGKPLYSRSVTGAAIKRACARAGLPVPHSPNHHMRRTFGRWAHFGQLVPGMKVPLYTVSRWLGHHSVKTTLIYLDIEEEDSARFMVPD